VPDAGLYTPLADVDRMQADQRTEDLIAEVLAFARAPATLTWLLCSHPLVLSRHVATANFEALRFLELARACGRSPLILEWPHDWFAYAVNASKRQLAKLPIEVAGQASKVRNVRVTRFTPDRRRLCDLSCIDGTSLVNFHHGLLAAVAGPTILNRVVNATAFYEADLPRSHYERLFALMTCMGVLADSYPLHGPEERFTEEVVAPAFEATVRRFGARPIVVRLLPAETECETFWEWYPPGVLRPALQAACSC
jgi:hypothetical protein